MPLTRIFKETVKARAEKSSAFRLGLVTEALESFFAGDSDTGKILLRDYLNATGYLGKIAEQLGKDEKSIRRMVGPKGNPTSKNLFALINAIQHIEHIQIRVSSKAA